MMKQPASAAAAAIPTMLLNCKASLCSDLSVNGEEGLIFFSSPLFGSFLYLPLDVAPFELDALPFHVCLDLLQCEAPGCQFCRFHKRVICLSLGLLLLDVFSIHHPHLLTILFVTLQSSSVMPVVTDG